MKANCPHCNALITNLRMDTVTGTAPNGTKWNCLVFACPVCNKVVSADVDMTAVRQDLIEYITGQAG